MPAFEEFSYEIEPTENDTYPDDASYKDEESEDNPFPTLEDAEQELITKALKHYKGNRRQTARALGISERTLYRKLKELDEEL